MASGQGRRASIQRAAKKFCEKADEVAAFAQDVGKISKERSVWAHDYAVIRLYREFETLMLEALVGAINNDTSTLSANTGVDFPKHLTKKVCTFLVTGTGYFDFRGRSGLIRTLDIVKQQKYRVPLDRLSALRNFAAHNSERSKKAALDATGVARLSSSGSWLRVNNRLEELGSRLKELAMEVHDRAPF